ncbi:MAG: tetratricopeptide repeat protein [Pirellulaceae bacterium]
MNVKRQLMVALLAGATGGLGGCKSPMGGLAFWNKDDSSFASSAPDVGRQKYAGLAQEFGAAPDGSSPGLGGTKVAADEGFFASGWNKTTAAVSSAFSPKPNYETNDPTSLASEVEEIGPNVYISAGRLLENQNKLPEAKARYEMALKVAPNDLTALVSLARLHDRQGQSAQAIELYQKAIKAHPKTALVHNDLGLCLARQKQWQPATASLNSAIALQPKNPKYRNNLATVLVELGRPDEALKQLTAVNGEAVAHYNLAYLLQQKGQSDQAIRHLQQAVAQDASLTAAHEMLAQLQGQTAGEPAAAYTARAGEGVATGVPAQPVSTPVPHQSATAGSVYSGSAYGNYHIGDESSSGGAGGRPAGTSNWGSEASTAPADGEGIELLPPVEG